MSEPNRKPPPTVAEAFFRQAFGCLAAVVVKIAIIVVIVLVIDHRRANERAREKEEAAKREAERATASQTAARIADEFAKATDADGRFVRKPEGELADADTWGRPFRLAYRPGTLSDGLEVRSAGPDGLWDNWDDVVVTRSSKISSKALTQEAASGLLEAAKKRLFGTKVEPEKK